MLEESSTESAPEFKIGPLLAGGWFALGRAINSQLPFKLGCEELLVRVPVLHPGFAGLQRSLFQTPKALHQVR